MNSTIILEQQALSFYCTEGLRVMSMVERYLGGKMFHETYPDLEASFWAANDSRDLKALKQEYRKLCRLHDTVSGD